MPSVFSTCLPILADSGVSLETFGKTGRCIRKLDGNDFLDEIRRHRALLARRFTEESIDGDVEEAYLEKTVRLRPASASDRKLIALLFRSDETIEFLVAALAAIAEGYTVVPLYPNWPAETQRLYLRRYRLRSLAVGAGFAQRAEEWAGDTDRILHVALGTSERSRAPGELDPAPANAREWPREVFPADLPADHPCAWIFTSGTSGSLAKCTEITLRNLDAAIENIRGLSFLREGMVVHSPLSASHIFAFVVIMAFLALKPRRMIFSDVQHLARLDEEATGKVDALILVPIVLNRLRAGFYEKLAGRSAAAASGRAGEQNLLQTGGKDGAQKGVQDGGRDDARRDAASKRRRGMPTFLRRGLQRLLRVAEKSIIAAEQGRARGLIGAPAVALSRALFGKAIRRRLGSPDFVVVGGAKPNLEAMALLEVMGVRCLQGWGMTETTGPLAVCRLEDRYKGAFGTCGELFPSTGAAIQDGELIVEGPQIASGYVEPDGTLVPFHGRKHTGDSAVFDRSGRLKVLGKASDRISTDNGLNYDPLPMEDELKSLDLARGHVLDESVVVGDGRPRLGCVFFVRERVRQDPGLRACLDVLVREYNSKRPIDEKIGPWMVVTSSAVEAGCLGPSGKLVRRRVEEMAESMYARAYA